MKSVLGMIVVFIGLYIIIYSDIFGFFAQKWVIIFAGTTVVASLIAAIFAFGLPFTHKKGGSNE